MTKKEAIELMKHGNPSLTVNSLKRRTLNRVNQLLEPHMPYPQGTHYKTAVSTTVSELAGIPSAFTLNMNTVEAILTWCGYE